MCVYVMRTTFSLIKLPLKLKFYGHIRDCCKEDGYYRWKEINTVR